LAIVVSPDLVIATGITTLQCPRRSRGRRKLILILL